MVATRLARGYRSVLGVTAGRARSAGATRTTGAALAARGGAARRACGPRRAGRAVARRAAAPAVPARAARPTASGLTGSTVAARRTGLRTAEATFSARTAGAAVTSDATGTTRSTVTAVATGDRTGVDIRDVSTPRSAGTAGTADGARTAGTACAAYSARAAITAAGATSTAVTTVAAAQTGRAGRSGAAGSTLSARSAECHRAGADVHRAAGPAVPAAGPGTAVAAIAAGTPEHCGGRRNTLRKAGIAAIAADSSAGAGSTRAAGSAHVERVGCAEPWRGALALAAGAAGLVRADGAVSALSAVTAEQGAVLHGVRIRQASGAKVVRIAAAGLSGDCRIHPVEPGTTRASITSVTAVAVQQAGRATGSTVTAPDGQRAVGAVAAVTTVADQSQESDATAVSAVLAGKHAVSPAPAITAKESAVATFATACAISAVAPQQTARAAVARHPRAVLSGVFAVADQPTARTDHGPGGRRVGGGEARGLETLRAVRTCAAEPPKFLIDRRIRDHHGIEGGERDRPFHRGRCIGVHAEQQTESEHRRTPATDGGRRCPAASRTAVTARLTDVALSMNHAQAPVCLGT